MSIRTNGVIIAGSGSGGTVTNNDNITITKNIEDKIQTEAVVNKNSATGAVPYLYDWIGTIDQYTTQDIVNTHPEWLCYIIDDDERKYNCARNIGDIFFTLRNDTVLNGAVACDGSTYQTTDYTGLDSIGELLENDKLPYVDLATYASTLSTYGVVGVFGWDGTGTTSFRVPTILDVFVEAGTTAQIGNYIAAGLPNITGSAAFGHNGSISLIAAASGSFIADNNRNVATYNGPTALTGNTRLDLDASQSDTIYGNSSTVQPRAIKYRPMIQLYTVLTDDAVANSHEVISFQLPTSENNYTWYRKYADGWIEQGGRTTINMTETGTSVLWTGSFPITMADTNYTFNIEEKSGWIYTVNGGAEGTSKTALSGWYQVSGGDLPRTIIISWQVAGIAEA